VMLESLGVSRLAKSFNDIGVAKKMGITSFAESGPLGSFTYDLPTSLPVNRKELIIGGKARFVGIGLKLLG